MHNPFYRCSAFCLSLLLCAVAACSSSKRAGVQNGVVGVALDQTTGKTSRALSFYMQGQLALNNEQLDRAKELLTRAHQLTDGPAPELRAALVPLLLRSGELELAKEVSTKLLDERKDADTLSVHAGILALLGHSSEARSSYELAISLDPKQVANYLLLGSLLFEVNDLAGAQDVFARLRKSDPKDPQAAYYLARIAEWRGDLGQAEANMFEAFKLRPDNQTLVLDVVRLLAKAGRLGKARQVVDEFLKNSRANVVVSTLAKVLLKPGVSSQEVLEKLSFLDNPGLSFDGMRLKLALAAVEGQRFQEAEQHLIFLLARSPDNSRARYYLGSLYAAAGRNRLALAELMRVESDAELFIEARTFASFLYKQLGDLEGAESAVREVLAVKPNDESLVVHLVDVLREAGKFKDGRDEVSKALLVAPRSEKLLFLKGLIMHELGDEPGAVAAMQEVVAINSQNAQALNYIAYALAESGKDLAHAQELVERALAISPDDGYFLDTQGWILHQRGEYAKAEEILVKAVNMTGDDVVIMEHYADCLLKNAKENKAVRIYQFALRKAEKSKLREELEAAPRIRRKLARIYEDFPHLSVALSK